MVRPGNPSSALLSLPQEIQDHIWAYAFANAELKLYRNRRLERTALYNDFTCCDPCAKSDDEGMDSASKHVAESRRRRHSAIHRTTPQDRYNELVRPMFACKAIMSSARKVFHSTLEIHLKSSEAIPWIRHTAPKTLRENVTKITLAAHFDGANHFLWLIRILELQVVFPKLKRLHLKYHMRPPISYDNMLDAMYVSMAVLGLRAPFNAPVHVMSENSTIPDIEAGTVIETAYQETQYLFSADFLGEVSTDDAIEEHTKVVAKLFTDPSYGTAARMVLNSNREWLDEYIGGKYGAYRMPANISQGGMPNEAFLPVAQHTLLAIARSHEKPWFEGLMRKRIVAVWIEHFGEGRREEIDNFMATVPTGQGIEALIEAVMERPGMAGLFGIETDED